DARVDLGAEVALQPLDERDVGLVLAVARGGIACCAGHGRVDSPRRPRLPSLRDPHGGCPAPAPPARRAPAHPAPALRAPQATVTADRPQRLTWRASE